MADSVEAAGHREGGSGTKSVTQQNGVRYHQHLGGEGQELLTINKLFPILGFFFTLEGSSLVSQEAGGWLGPPQWECSQALCSPYSGHLSLLSVRGKGHTGDPKQAHLTEECVIDIPGGLQCQVRKSCLVGHHIQKLL